MSNRLYLGIDPSINSTGITILNYDNDILIDTRFFIVKPNKITKKELNIEKFIPNFNYILYEKYDLSQYKDDNHIYEYYKTCNMINIVTTIYNTILSYIEMYDINFISIVMEGISYGSSLRTKSIFDLSGLNYMIRYKFILDKVFDNSTLTIATPGNIKKFATGKGNANKDIILTTFKAIFPYMENVPKLDDIADSYFMACFALDLDKKTGTT